MGHHDFVRHVAAGHHRRTLAHSEGNAMISVVIEHVEPSVAASMARQLYLQFAAEGRHVIIDTPFEFRTNLPERRLSAADIILKLLAAPQPTTTQPSCKSAISPFATSSVSPSLS